MAVGRFRFRAASLLVCIAVFAASAAAQIPQIAVPPASTAAQVSRTITGRVVNALDGVPIQRAMVILNGRQALADSQGKFEFPEFTETRATVMASKPGFSMSDQGPVGNRPVVLSELDATVEVKLYPDALITGVVAGRDGLPLSRVQIQLMSRMFDGSGFRWIQSGFGTTNSHGEYRIRTPAGQFRVSLMYVAQSPETGEAILPQTFPSVSSSDGGGTLAVGSGEERRIDFRVRGGPAYPVYVRMDSSTSDPYSRPRFVLTTGSGDSFSAAFSRDSRSGEYRVMLPNGTYTLRARVDERNDSLDGSTRFTVAGREVTGVYLHLATDPNLPVEISIDPANSTALSSNASNGAPGQVINQQQPDLRMFNLYLRNRAGANNGFDQDIQMRPQEDKSYAFRVHPGRYRIAGAGGGAWYVESITSGQTDLLANDLVIAQGTAASPIRIVVGNQRGTLHGHVSAGSASVPSGLFVYLLPRSPNLTPPFPIGVGSDGSFGTSLPVGSYMAFAVDHRLEEDLRDASFLDRIRTGTKAVEVTVNTDASVGLEIAQMKEEPR